MVYLGTQRITHFDDKMSFDEKLVAAGMNFKIRPSFVRYVGSEQHRELHVDTKHVVLFRDDKPSIALSIVSDKFKIAQPRAIFNFFRDLCEELKWNMVSASVMFDGRKYWALADTGMDAEVLSANDRMKAYLLLSSSCDGSSPTEARYLSHRINCNNQLPMINSSKALVRISHRSKFDPFAIKEAMGIALHISREKVQEEFAVQMNLFRSLASTPLSNYNAAQLTNLILGREDGDKPSHISTRLNELFYNGHLLGSTGVEDKTVWRWLNCVTQYVDHEARAKTADHRLNNAWYGVGNDLKENALRHVVGSFC